MRNANTCTSSVLYSYYNVISSIIVLKYEIPVVIRTGTIWAVAVILWVECNLGNKKERRKKGHSKINCPWKLTHRAQKPWTGRPALRSEASRAGWLLGGLWSVPTSHNLTRNPIDKIEGVHLFPNSNSESYQFIHNEILQCNCNFNHAREFCLICQDCSSWGAWKFWKEATNQEAGWWLGR